MKEIKALYFESLKNRAEYLSARQGEWLNAPSDRKQKEIIVELIQLEPSHLAEGWIMDQVIKWMKNREENLDYIEAAFIAQGKRDSITEKQQVALARTSFLDYGIQIKAKKMGSKIAAVRDVVLNGDDNSPEEMAIIQKLKRYRKSIDWRELPFPYFGKDVIEYDRGNEAHRVDFVTTNKPVIFSGIPLFGNTIFSIPYAKLIE